MRERGSECISEMDCPGRRTCNRNRDLGDLMKNFLVNALSFTVEMILMFIFVIALPVATWWLMILLVAK